MKYIKAGIWVSNFTTFNNFYPLNFRAFLLVCHHNYIVRWHSTDLNTINHFIATHQQKKPPKLNEGRKPDS